MAQKKQWMRKGAVFALALTTAASMHAGALATIPVQEDGAVVAQTEPEVQEEQTQTATIDSASMETAESEEIEAVAEEVPTVQSVEANEPESGLRFDSVKNEYVQVQGTVQIPNTVEVWAKIDAKEDRRQIIMNNYGRGGNTWGIEVTANNTLRYWENTDDSYVDWKSDIEVCTGEWVLISVVRNIEESKIQVYINGEFVDEYDVSGFAENAIWPMAGCALAAIIIRHRCRWMVRSPKCDSGIPLVPQRRSRRMLLMMRLMRQKVLHISGNWMKRKIWGRIRFLKIRLATWM